jgi:hypothetical protein
MRSPIALPHRRRRRPPLTVVTTDREPLTPGPPSHVLCPRPHDLGPGWAMHARRCRALLPPALEWAAPLLDPDQPRPVLCAHAQARALLLWHHHLPSWAHVSLGCRHTRAARRTPAPR